MKDILLRFVRSLNPNSYSELVDEKLRASCKHFLIQFCLLFVLLSLLFIPAYFMVADDFSQKLGSFSKAHISGSFASDEPVLLLTSPRIVFDENATSTQGAKVVFGDGAMYYKRFFWFGERSLSYASIQDASSLDAQIIALLALFILPSLIFWSGMYLLLKTLVLVFLFSLLGYILVGAFKQSITYARSLQVAFISAAPALFIDVLLFGFYRSFWIPFLIHVLFFTIGVALLSERKLAKKKNKNTRS